MKKSTRFIATVATSAVALCGGVLVASALWNASKGVTVPDFQLGAVIFSAQPIDGTDNHEHSIGGKPVAVTLPGKTVIEVLDQTSASSPPVIWRFKANGTALGITGLNHSVRVVEQTARGAAHDLGGGIAKPGTVLEQSTLKVYPASAGGDCSAIPDTPELGEGEDPKNIHLFGAEDAVLQAPGTAAQGGVSEQEWCVAIAWNNEGDGMYLNDVQVMSTAEDGTSSSAMGSWHAAVGFPPTLEKAGVYRNRADTQGTAEDSTLAKASDEWFVDVYPDPSNEPDVLIEIDPIVTSVNPAIDPRD